MQKHQPASQPSIIKEITFNQLLSNTIKDLQYLLNKLISKYNPLHILCFNHICERKQLKGCFGEGEAETSNTYYLLMVTTDIRRIENSVQDFANAHYNQGSVIIIVHGNESIEKSIASGNTFFKSVYQTGKLLYTQGNFFWIRSFTDAILDANHQAKQHRFEQSLARAKGFFRCAQEECHATGDLQVCAFLLHQVVEQYCIAIIGLHMDYRCDIHNLYRLVMLSRCFTEKLYNLFLTNDGDQELFKKLSASYIACRYRSDFDISEAELKKLVFKIHLILK